MLYITLNSSSIIHDVSLIPFSGKQKLKDVGLHIPGHWQEQQDVMLWPAAGLVTDSSIKMTSFNKDLTRSYVLKPAEMSALLVHSLQPDIHDHLSRRSTPYFKMRLCFVIRRTYFSYAQSMAMTHQCVELEGAGKICNFIQSSKFIAFNLNSGQDLIYSCSRACVCVCV